MFAQEAAAQQVAQQVAQQEAVPNVPEGEDWTFKFGTHTRKTLDVVLRTDPDYVPWMLASRVHVQPWAAGVEEELKRRGLWEEMVEKAEVMKVQMSIRAKQKLDAAKAKAASGQLVLADELK